MHTWKSTPVLIAILFASLNSLFAHDGKRLDVVVIDNQLYAQGYLSGLDPVNDGGGITRPYYNTIHSHFTNIGSNTIANSQLPGFDIRMDNASELMGHDLNLALIGAGKWDEPPAQDGTGLAQEFGTPVLSELAIGEVLSVALRTETVTTENFGESLELATSVSGDVFDIDPNYEINLQPSNALYFLEWQLSTSNPDILDSESIYTIHSPDGVGPVKRLHFQSLALERHFGIAAVPEPGALSLIGLLTLSTFARRKSSKLT